MPGPLLYDTDVMVDFLRGRSSAINSINKYSESVILSSITVAELYAGVKGDHELKTLDNLFYLFRVIPVSPEIARLGGLYKNEFGKSHGVGLADAIIAATCQVEHAELITLNTKHYPMMKGLKPAYSKA